MNQESIIRKRQTAVLTEVAAALVTFSYCCLRRPARTCYHIWAMEMGGTCPICNQSGVNGDRHPTEPGMLRLYQI